MKQGNIMKFALILFLILGISIPFHAKSPPAQKESEKILKFLTSIHLKNGSTMQATYEDSDNTFHLTTFSESIKLYYRLSVPPLRSVSNIRTLGLASLCPEEILVVALGQYNAQIDNTLILLASDLSCRSLKYNCAILDNTTHLEIECYTDEENRVTIKTLSERDKCYYRMKRPFHFTQQINDPWEIIQEFNIHPN